jgi:hypothetical protein
MRAAAAEAEALDGQQFRTMQTLGRAAGVAAIVAAAAACAFEPEPSWTALDRPMTFGAVAEFSFVAEQSGPHQVLVQFAYPITDQQVEALVDSAAATTGESGAPMFEFSWSVFHEGATIGRRDGPQRSTGVVDTHTSGLGEGPRVSRGLVFGDCRLEAGRVYTLRIEPGARFDRVANAHPRVVVAYQPYTLGLSQ